MSEPVVCAGSPPDPPKTGWSGTRPAPDWPEGRCGVTANPRWSQPARPGPSRQQGPAAIQAGSRPMRRGPAPPGAHRAAPSASSCWTRYARHRRAGPRPAFQPAASPSPQVPARPRPHSPLWRRAPPARLPCAPFPAFPPAPRQTGAQPMMTQAPDRHSGQ